MKKITLVLIFLFGTTLHAQVGINTTTPDASSMLDIAATNKGVLVPRVSLTNVTLTTLDGTNTAATGLLIWNTNATTVGGNGVGFYFYNGTQWMPITQTQVVDADFYEIGTMTAPDNINDNIFTQGKVAIGKNTADYRFEVEETGAGGAFPPIIAKFTDNGTSTNSHTGVDVEMNASTTSAETGVNINMPNSNSVYKKGVVSFVQNGTGSNTGFEGRIRGSGINRGVDLIIENSVSTSTNSQTAYSAEQRQATTGQTFGLLNTFATNNLANDTGSKFGVRNVFGSNTGGELYGTYNYFDPTLTSIANKYGTFTDIPNTLGGTHYGIYSRVFKPGSYAGFFQGNLAVGTTGANFYILPPSRGTNGQVMQTDGTGNVSWQNPTIATSNTLDQAYDQGGLGAGKNINATDGAVRINGDDGFLVTGTFGSGNTIDTEITGTGVRMFFNPRKAAFRAGYAFFDSWDDLYVGNYSTAFGNGSIASGYTSTAFGASRAFGDLSTAFGGGTFAYGEGSTAFGLSTQSDGYASTAFGASTSAQGTTSTAFGDTNNSWGNTSTSFGGFNNARGTYSTAFGINNSARSFGEIAIGIGATDYTTSTNGDTQFRTSNQNDRLFVIGNAIDANANGTVDFAERSNALTIFKNGRMNINDAYNMPLTDGTANQVMKTDGAGNVTWQNTITANTLDQAYDQGGLGAGKNINATDGAVRINGDDGFLVTGTFGTGNTIDTEITGAGTRMFFNPRKAAFRAGLAIGTQWNDLNLGNFSAAFGTGNTVSGEASAAFGSGNSVSSLSSAAFGEDNDASGAFNFITGTANITSGENSTAIGQSLTVGGDLGIALGSSNTVNSNGGIAIGSNLEAFSGFETVLGLNSTTYIPLSTTGFNANDRLLAIGNGATIASRSNALTIYKNGRMNINDAYNMPLTDGTSNQIMRTDGIGNVSWVNSSTVFTDTDAQTIDVLSLTGDVLNISLQNDGLPTQTIDLSSIDNQATDVFSLTGTTLNLSLQNDGVATQTVDLSSLSNDWKLTGNAGTNSTTNFIGTTDNQDLVFKRNNGFSGSIGSNNTSFGVSTLNQATTGSTNAAFGTFTLTSNTTGESNSAVGYNVLRNNTSGSFNVALGRSALFANTIGIENTAIGNNTSTLNSTSSGNIAVGFDALYSQSFNNAGVAWYSYNTAIGYASLRSNQPGATTNAIQNTAVGAFTLNNNLRGKNNTALGFEASRNNRNSSQNVAIGSRALFSMSHPNGGTEWETNNVAIGFESLFSNQPTNATNAINNTSVGTQSLYSNTTGIGNTAMGYRALYSNTTGASNVAIGVNALTLNTASSNVAVGAFSLSTNTTGTENTAVGRAALDTNTSGNYNTAIGRNAMDTNSTGDALTGLGRGTDVSIDGLTNATAIGYNAIVNESDKVRIGNAGILVIEGQVAYTYPSDARFKFNIQDNVPGLLFIKKLKPITYQFDTEKFETFVGGNTKENGTQSFQKSTEIIHSGFLAQDIEKICQEVNYDFDGLHVPNSTNKTDHYSLAYSQFIMPMIKAMQEQQDIIEQQGEQIKNLENEKNVLQSLINKINQMEEKINLLEKK
jgi:hypothetical protein